MERTQWHLPGDVFFCLGPTKRSILWMSQYQTPLHHGWRRPMHSLTWQDSACPSNEKWLFFNRSSSLSNFRTRLFEEKFFSLLSQSSTMSRDVCRQVIIFLLLQIQIFFITVLTSQVPLKSQFSKSVISVPFLVTRLNRPIVFLQSGHEVRGIPDFWSYKKHCFLHFSETLSWPIMVWNDWFFSLLEIHRWCLMMCSSCVGTGKSPDLSDFHPCRSGRSLAITPCQLSWPELRKGDNQEEKSISRWRKTLVWNLIIKGENGATSLCLQVRVPREWSSRQAACIDGLATCIATEHSPELQKSTQTIKSTPIFTEPTKEFKCCSFYFFTLLVFFFKKKKEKAAFELPGSKKGWVDHIQAMHLLGICARAQTQLSNFFRERFWPCKLLVVVIGLAPIPRRQPKFYRDSLMEYRFFEDNGESAYGALCKSIDCQGSEGFTRQLHKFSFEKKKTPLVNGKSKNRQKLQIDIFPWEVPLTPKVPSWTQVTTAVGKSLLYFSAANHQISIIFVSSHRQEHVVCATVFVCSGLCCVCMWQNKEKVPNEWQPWWVTHTIYASAMQIKCNMNKRPIDLNGQLQLLSLWQKKQKRFTKTKHDTVILFPDVIRDRSTRVD